MKETSVILLVVNEQTLIYQLEQAFRKNSLRHPIRVARYGNEALLYLKGIGVYSNRQLYPLPDLLVLDLANPDGSSMVLLGWIREQKIFNTIPIVIMVSNEHDRVLQNALDLGANAFVVKRDEQLELISLIKSLELLGEISNREKPEQDKNDFPGTLEFFRIDPPSV
ncbi:MAG: response regulator [Verrucomicrobiota bacterium]|nr:response regulator [Verrucomicrobiota bacterium]